MSFAIKVIVVLLLVFLLEFYFFKKVINSIKILFPKIKEKHIAIGKWIVISIINIYPIIAIFGWIYVYLNKIGYFSLPENFFFDYFILYPFWVGTIIIIQSSLINLIIDLLNLILFPFLKAIKQKVIFTKSFLFFLIFIAALIYVPLRINYDYNSVEINKIELIKEDIPKLLKGFKIAFISDIQADRFTNENRLNNFIDKVNAESPDLVLIAGDLITSTPDYIEFSAQQLSKIKSKYGIFTCVGDHDNWAYRGDNERSVNEITTALSQVNIHMINNDKKMIRIGDTKIEILFITNTYVERINNSLLDQLSLNSNYSDLRIFLTHQPQEFLIKKAIENKFDLFLAGHTHGGQITFLFPFYNLSPTMIETSLMRGSIQFNETLVIVTRGLGMSLSPVRYNSTPEIIIIEIN